RGVRVPGPRNQGTASTARRTLVQVEARALHPDHASGRGGSAGHGLAARGVRVAGRAGRASRSYGLKRASAGWPARRRGGSVGQRNEPRGGGQLADTAGQAGCSAALRTVKLGVLLTGDSPCWEVVQR